MILLLLLMVIVIALFFGGCATAPTVSLSEIQTQQSIQAGKTSISPQNLTCRPEPRSPGGDATDRQAAAFVLDLAAAGRDCRSKLQAVRETIEGDR